MKLNGNPYLHDATWRAKYAAAAEDERMSVAMRWGKWVRENTDRYPAFAVHAFEVLNRLVFMRWEPRSWTLETGWVDMKPERKRLDWAKCSDGIIRFKGDEA